MSDHNAQAAADLDALADRHSNAGAGAAKRSATFQATAAELAGDPDPYKACQDRVEELADSIKHLHACYVQAGQLTTRHLQNVMLALDGFAGEAAALHMASKVHDLEANR